MANKLLSFFIMATAGLLYTSCLNNNDYDDVSIYDDTAVTAFSLQSAVIEKHTKARDGVTDSTYRTTYDAKALKFYIDQQQCLIYNADSLPYGINPKRITCNIQTKNRGIPVFVLKDKNGQDSLKTVNENDSVDFTRPVRLRVYSLSRTAYRDYIVKVNIHQQTGTEFTWQSAGMPDEVTRMGNRKIVNNNGKLFLFGENGKTVGYRHGGNGWQKLEGQDWTSDAWSSLTAMGGYLYLLDDGKLIRSEDGLTWETMNPQPNIEVLVGASKSKLYALTESTILVSDDNGATWKEETLDADHKHLPHTNLSLSWRPSRTNAKTNQLVLIGTHNGEVKIWSKVEENEKGSQNQPWAYYPEDEHNTHRLPAMTHLQVTAYDGGLIAVGDNFKTFYTSKDDGLTWHADNTFMLPEAFGTTPTTAAFALATDNHNRLCISKPFTNQIWFGLLARLSWTTGKKAFTE